MSVRRLALVCVVALATAGCVYFPHSLFDEGEPTPLAEVPQSATVAVPAGPSPLIPVPADTREIKAKRRSLARLERVLGLDDTVTINTAIELAELLAAEGRQAEAEPLLSQTLEQVEGMQGPTGVGVAQVAISLAEARLAAGRDGEARTLAKRAAGILEETPARNPAVQGDVLRRAARIQLRLGHLDQAQALFKHAYQAELGAVPPQEPVPDVDPGKPLPVAIQDQILPDLQQRNPARSMIRLNTAIEEHPEMAGLFLWRARVGMFRGSADGTLLDPEAAELDLRHSMELDPSLLDAYASFADLYERQKRLGEGIEAASANGSDPATRIRLGELYAMAGNAEQAIEAYESAVAVDGAPTASKNGLARLLAREADGDAERLDRALELARAARAEEPERPSVADTLGRVLVEHEQGDEAIPVLLQALDGYGTLEPEIGPARYALGRAYAQSGDLDRAIEQLEYALGAQPFPSRQRAARLLSELEARLMPAPEEQLDAPIDPEGLASEPGLSTSYSEGELPEPSEVPEGYEVIEEGVDDGAPQPDGMTPPSSVISSDPPELPDAMQPPAPVEREPEPDREPDPEMETPGRELLP